MGIANGLVLGSLIASLLISDWRIPRRAYHAALAAILLIGIIAEEIRVSP